MWRTLQRAVSRFISTFFVRRDRRALPNHDRQGVRDGMAFCAIIAEMRFVLAILLAAGVTAAQTPAPSASSPTKSDWANVKRLAAGEEIRVSMSDGKSFRGQLQSTTDESLIMVAASAQQTLARPQITKIAAKGASHRGRNALIGLGVGAGGGLAIGAATDAGNHGWFQNVGKEVFTPLGALVGDAPRLPNIGLISTSGSSAISDRKNCLSSSLGLGISTAGSRLGCAD